MSFHGPLAAIAFAASSVRLVPPTASTNGEVAGHDAWICLSAVVSWSAGTPCAHAEEPASPAATTTVMPSAALRRELALDERARGGVGRDRRLADAVGDRDHVRQRRAVRRRLQRRVEQLEEAEHVAVVGLLVESLHPEVEALELRRDHRDHHRVERALEDRLDAEPPWIFSAVPAKPKHERNVSTSAAGVGASPTIASSRPGPAGRGLERRDPVRGERAGSGTARAARRSRARVGQLGRRRRRGRACRRRATACRRRRGAAAARARPRGRLACCTVSRMPATVSTLPYMPLGSFGVFTGSATTAPFVRVP